MIGETEVVGEAGQRPLTLGEPLACFPHPKLVAVGVYGRSGAGVEDAAQVMRRDGLPARELVKASFRIAAEDLFRAIGEAAPGRLGRGARRGRQAARPNNRRAD